MDRDSLKDKLREFNDLIVIMLPSFTVAVILFLLYLIATKG